LLNGFIALWLNRAMKQCNNVIVKIMNTGKIIQVIGPVVDVEFGEESELPKIYDAVEVKIVDGTLIAEVHQHLGGNRVRAVAMGTTDGVRRGMEVVATGAPISVPVGKAVLGRMFNVLGKAIDGKEDVVVETKRSIHRTAPAFDEQSTKAEVSNRLTSSALL
jgi:F-type H+-transporting ATPase subunit beta